MTRLIDLANRTSFGNGEVIENTGDRREEYSLIEEVSSAKEQDIPPVTIESLDGQILQRRLRSSVRGRQIYEGTKTPLTTRRNPVREVERESICDDVSREQQYLVIPSSRTFRTRDISCELDWSDYAEAISRLRFGTRWRAGRKNRGTNKDA